MKKKIVSILLCFSLLPLLSMAQQSDRCSDAVFMRRLHLVMTGQLPDADATRRFLDSQRADKRDELIDVVLQSEPYYRQMLLHWGDILRIKSEFPSNLWPNGVQAYNRWIYKHLADNTPYDVFVQQLLLSKGSNFKDPAVNFYRAFLDRTPAVIHTNIHLLFMGDQKPDAASAICFSQLRYKSTKEWKEEIVYPDVWSSRKAHTLSLAKEQVVLQPATDWREPYVNWLTSENNRQFAQVFVNRLWFWIMGEGLVTDPDPAVWPKRKATARWKELDAHVDFFIESGYNVRELTRRLLQSDAFQLQQAADYGFKSRRLPAETIVDAIATITQEHDVYQSRVPEPFTFYPQATLSRDLGDATVSSPTLELFGRASRDVSLQSQRKNQLTDRQVLYLMNSNDLEGRIRRSKPIAQTIAKASGVDELTEQAFLQVLLRYPTPAERRLFKTYAAQNQGKMSAYAYDLYWTLMNSHEFLYY